MKIKAQIWVETVIYTVIGLAIIATVLAIATPSINKYKDEIVIEQTISDLNELNGLILELRDWGLGNKREADFTIKKGNLVVDGSGNNITYTMERTGLKFSEPGEDAVQGDIVVRTEKVGRKYQVSLTINYDDIDLTFNGGNNIKKFTHAPAPYKLFIENNGTLGDKIQIDIKESY